MRDQVREAIDARVEEYSRRYDAGEPIFRGDETHPASDAIAASGEYSGPLRKSQKQPVKLPALLRKFSQE